MTWITPRTYVTGEIVTAAFLNQTRDDLNALQALRASVATAEGTASTTFVDLTTSGPAITVSTLTEVTVTLTTKIQSNTANEGGMMGVAVSGASTISAVDKWAVGITNAATTRFGVVSATVRVTGLTAGSNTFTAKYRAFAGTCTFTERQMQIVAA